MTLDAAETRWAIWGHIGLLFVMMLFGGLYMVSPAWFISVLSVILLADAAGNFLCPAESLSFNAYRTVMDIDALGTFNVTKAVFDASMKVSILNTPIYTIQPQAIFRS